MDATFTLFDHTADIGLRIRAASRPELLPPAGAALYSVIGALRSDGPGRQTRIELTDGDPAELLRDYLNELLLLFERDRRIATDVTCENFEPDRLSATITTRPIDGKASALHREVKAITYHELNLRQVDDGFEATTIVDI